MVITVDTTKLLELKMAKIRLERNALLAATDWAVLPDSPVNTPELLTYRQALRDITTTYPNPDNVIWPISPLGG